MTTQEFFTNEELVDFYNKLKMDVDAGHELLWTLTLSEGRKLLTVLAAYDGEFGSCTIR